MRRNLRLLALILTLLGVFIFVLWLNSTGKPVWDCAVAAPAGWYGCLSANGAVLEPLTSFLLALAAVAAILADIVLPDGDKSKEYNPTREERTNNRKELIRRVKKIWIDGYLNQSLLPAAMWQLGLEWNPADPPPAPYGMKAQRQNQTPLDLAAGPQMVTFYEQVDHRLLILGAPGAGKTTVMLDLAKSYLDRAEKDASIHIPVIFTLSSWLAGKMPFEDWLVSEMRLRYGTDITDKVARYWLEHNEIALFLDGLDELPEDRRDDTVKGVKAYCETVFDRWYVVCSRSAEYVALANGFTELDSVEIEPVTPAQIQGYLAELDGEQPRQLAATIAGDATLQEVADTPLMLNVMLLAADAVNWSELPTDKGADVARAFIYDAYIEKMLVRPRRGKKYAAAKTLKWLQWLAQKMKEHDQTVFLMERIDRSWFGEESHSKSALGPIIERYRWQIDINRIEEHVRLELTLDRLIYGLIVGAFLGLIFGLTGGLIGLFGGFLGIFGLPGGFSGLSLGLSLGLRGGLVFGFIIGVFLGLISVLLDRSSTLEQSFGSSRPNYGVRQSLRNGLIIGALSGLLIGLIFGLIFGVFLGLTLGLFFGLVVALHFGLGAAIEHYNLRFLLCLDGSMPLNYVRFLDACADRILLRKVGGGYMFPHITFRDHFAALTPEDIDALVQRIEAR